MPDNGPSKPGWSRARSEPLKVQVEGLNSEIRMNVLKFDEVMNEQRKVIYAARKRILHGDDLKREVRQIAGRHRRWKATTAKSAGTGISLLCTALERCIRWTVVVKSALAQSNRENLLGAGAR